MSFTTNYYKTFAIAGGTGNLGSKIAKELLEEDFSVVLLSRSVVSAVFDSTRILVESGAKIQTVDYNDVESITKALKGIQVVINTMGQETLPTRIAQDLAIASRRAGAELVVPNDWGVNMDLVVERNDPPLHAFVAAKADYHDFVVKVSLPKVSLKKGGGDKWGL